MYEDSPKSGASDATIPLGGETVAVLSAWRAQQAQDRLLYGADWIQSGRVFTALDGSALHPTRLTRVFEWAAFDAGLPPIRLHDLRHCAATLAFAAGGDIKAVSAMMRHSSITITADIYTAVLEEVHAEIADAMTHLVPRRRQAAGGSGTGGPITVPPVRPLGRGGVGE